MAGKKPSKDNTAIIVALISTSGVVLAAFISIFKPFAEPRLAKTPTPDLSPTPFPTPILTESIYPIILQDDYTINRGLDVWEMDLSTGGVLDGVFRIAVIQPGITTWRTYDGVEVENFYLKVDINMPPSTKEYACGIVFRQDDHGRYLFSLNNNRRFEILNMVEANGTSEDKQITYWDYAPSANTRGKNTLEIIAIKDTFEFFINGEKVNTSLDATHEKGAVGFFVSTYGEGQEAIVEFDNLLIEER